MSRTNDSIGCLPEEMQACILSKLNGKTAAVAKKVCKLWNEIIKDLETFKNFWLHRCLQEIPPYTLVELTRLTQLSGGKENTLVELTKDWRTSLQIKLPWMFWREIYAEYSRCGYIVHGKEEQKEIHYFPTHSDITCLHIKDNVMYSGHAGGHVISWENLDEELHYELLYSHWKKVTDITGLDMAKTTRHILLGELNNKIISSAKDRTIVMYNIDTESWFQLEIEDHNTYEYVGYVRSWGKNFFASANTCSRGRQSVWKSKTHSDEADQQDIISTDISAKVTAFAIWDGNVVLGDEKGNLFTGLNIYNLGDALRLEANIGGYINSIFLLGKRVVCYTSDGLLHVSRYKEHYVFNKHDINKCLNKTPECVVIHGSVLAIGCRSGAVYMYHLPSDRDWDNLNLATPSRVIQTSHDHINAVAIGDDGDGPYVVIATEGCSFLLVKYRRQKASSKKTVVKEKYLRKSFWYSLDKNTSPWQFLS